MEGTEDVEADANIREGTAYLSMLHRAADEAGPEGEDYSDLQQATLGILSGSARSQLEASFFMAAYAFLFPYSIGAPDLKYQERDRRPKSAKDAPVVDFEEDWSKAIMQRAEAQFRRDLTMSMAV